MKAPLLLTAALMSAQLFQPALAADKTLRIINNRAAFPIWQVYITPAGQADWGRDQLGNDVIGAGKSYAWTIPWSGCRIDVQARTAAGLSAEIRGVDVCGGFEWTLYDEAPKQQRKRLQIVNNRRAFPIWYVYITPAGQADWGSDQLGEQVIGAGGSHAWTIPWESCHVDVKAVSFTGLSTEARNIDVCGGMVWTIVDGNPKQ